MKSNNFKPIKELTEKEDKEIDKSKNNDNHINEDIDKEISESLEKEKQLQIQQEKEKAELNAIIKLLKLEKDKRIKADIIRIKDYLSTHIDYFKNLLDQSEEKLLKLIPLLNFEVFKPNERIMNFGEEGDKCYILLKGKVGIYKPTPITKQMTLRDYVEYLVHIRDIEKNMPKFERVLNYNSKVDKFKLISIDFDYTKIPRSTFTLNIMVEEERELGKGNPGSSFGEMALIKNEPRNASIIALERCSMISIEKNNYTKIVKDIEEQRINKELAIFKQNYPIFRYWQPSKCFRLISGFITLEYDKDDYVFKQNDIPTGIYLIKEGTFEITSYFNFNWYEKFIDYIHDSSYSLINDIDNPMIWKEDKITKKINDAFNNKPNPFVINRDPMDKAIISKQNEDNEKDIAKDIEEEINQNKNQIFKTNIQTLEAPNFFGFLEIFELKFRICSVKCISKKGILMKFPLLEFLQLIPTDKRNQFYLQQRIFKEKKYVISQLKNSILAKLNFVKKEGNKNFYISKDFFNNNNTNKTTNKIDFKKQYIDQSLTPLRNLKISHDMNLNPKLNKSKSSIYYNIPKIEKNKNIILSKDYIKSEDYIKNNNIPNFTNNNDISFEARKHNSKNGIILGFKKSVIKLTRDKMEIIKGLFPKEAEKKSLAPSLNIKQINNSDKEYIKYLENNVELSKTPHKLRNLYIKGTNGMTCKKYVSLEASKFIYNLNKNNNKTKSTNESKRNSELLLPYINNARNSIINNNNNEKANNSRIRLINYKVEE